LSGANLPEDNLGFTRSQAAETVPHALTYLIAPAHPVFVSPVRLSSRVRESTLLCLYCVKRKRKKNRMHGMACYGNCVSYLGIDVK
jgi:hypothetical protein